ncbi:MAG: hypothetical protein HY482_00500 [Candidatus Wildermuthbacteria bacterium]|nr:hypothetical protein [Candidatus Wildermuthbacteria bacterium]
MTKKQSFLLEHNRLSSADLQATLSLLARFKADKPLIVKDETWVVEKLRRPFIFWLTSFSSAERKAMG